MNKVGLTTLINWILHRLLTGIHYPISDNVITGNAFLVLQ